MPRDFVSSLQKVEDCTHSGDVEQHAHLGPIVVSTASMLDKNRGRHRHQKLEIFCNHTATCTGTHDNCHS